MSYNPCPKEFQYEANRLGLTGNGEWDRKYHLCGGCYRKYDPESLHNLIKSMRLSRIGNLEIESEIGKSVIGQWMTAKVLKLTDNNIEKNNFREKVDLSKHYILGKVEVTKEDGTSI